MDDQSLARLAAVPEAAGGSSAALAAAAAHARAGPAGSTAVVLVEGMSDQSARATLAARRGRNLSGEGVFVVPMGGATNIGHFLDLFGPSGFGVRLAGLCDQGEEGDFRRSLARAGLGATVNRVSLERLGFFVCVADLEDELIRSLGPQDPLRPRTRRSPRPHPRAPSARWRPRPRLTRSLCPGPPRSRACGP